MKILDFGLAKVVPIRLPEQAVDEESLTMEGVIPGTTAYMSPEQVRGEAIDARSDLFSLGVVLYEMATAKRPFGGKNRVVLMDAILNQKPFPPSSMNPWLRKLSMQSSYGAWRKIAVGGTRAQPKFAPT